MYHTVDLTPQLCSANQVYWTANVVAVDTEMVRQYNRISYAFITLLFLKVLDITNLIIQDVPPSHVSRERDRGFYKHV